MDIVERLKIIAETTSADWPTASIDCEYKEAVKEIERLRSENAELREELDAVLSALPWVRYMDPPDGGSVTLGEPVRRMREERDALQERWKQFEEYDCDELKAAYALVDKVKQERDALAATVVELRKVANDVSIIGGVKYGDDDLMKMLANAVFSSVRPTAILAARDARVKAEALRTAGNAANNAGKFDVCWSLHAMADAIEKGE